MAGWSTVLKSLLGLRSGSSPHMVALHLPLLLSAGAERRGIIPFLLKEYTTAVTKQTLKTDVYVYVFFGHYQRS